MNRRRLLALAGAAAAAGLAARPAAAQLAGRTIRLVYAYAAGGSGDGMARLLADRLGPAMGTSAIVENKAGASGRIGTKSVIAAEPDGTTLLFSPLGPMSLHPIVYANLDFDPFKDLAPVSQVATFDTCLMVGADVPARTLKELVAWLKANPEKANYGTPGFGGLPHFFAVMFAGSSGITLRNVPYRGGAAAMNDLVAGQLPIALLATADGLALAQAGKARILATSGKARSPFLPDVPTFIEAGYDIHGDGWYGVFAPARTPAALLAQLSSAIQQIMREPQIQERARNLGLVPTGTTAEALARIQKADQDLWAPAIRASGFKPTD